MTRVDPRGVICSSKMTRVDLKTLPYMPHGKEMAMSFGLIYILVANPCNAREPIKNEIKRNFGLFFIFCLLSLF